MHLERHFLPAQDGLPMGASPAGLWFQKHGSRALSAVGAGRGVCRNFLCAFFNAMLAAGAAVLALALLMIVTETYTVARISNDYLPFVPLYLFRRGCSMAWWLPS